MANREWQKVEMNPMWNYKDEDGKFSLKSGDELVGVYLGFEENIGSNNSNVYTFRKENGDKISVWGTTVLDSRLKNLNVNEEVKIAYKGSVKSEKVKGRAYHDFDVWHREAEFEPVPDQEIPIMEEEE